MSDLEEMRTHGWVSLRAFARDVAGITYPTALRWKKQRMINWQMRGGLTTIPAEEIRRFLKEGTLPPDPIERQKEIDKRIAREQKRNNTNPVTGQSNV